MINPFDLVDYGVVGNGVADDTVGIQNALTAAQNAGGGFVFLPKGQYKISSTLTIARSSVGLVGAGFSWHPNNANAAIWAPATELLWYGNTTDPFIKVDYGADSNPCNGIVLRDFGLNLRESCAIGVELVGTEASFFSNVGIKNASSGTLSTTAWYLHPLLAEAASTIDVKSNLFQNLWAGVVSYFMRCDGSTSHTSNCSNNTFVNLIGNFGLNSSAADGILINDGDNNTFVGVQMSRAAGGTGYGIHLADRARANYFYKYGGNAGMLCDTPAIAGKANVVFGYDRENAQPTPTLSAGAALTWTEDGSNNSGWSLASLLRCNAGLNVVAGGLTVTAGGAAITGGLTVGGGTPVTGILSNSATYDPPSTSSGNSWTTTIAVTGAAVGDFVIANHTSIVGGWLLYGFVSAVNTVTVVAANHTGSTSNLASGTLEVIVFKM